MPTEAQIRDAVFGSMTDVAEEELFFQGMIYGESGVGKTVAAMEIAQAISKTEILYTDAVKGWVSLRNHPSLMERVTRMKYQGLSQIQAFINAFREGDPRATRFDTLVFDEISTIAQLDLDNVHTAYVKEDRKGTDPDTPQWPEMNANTHRIRRLTIALGSLDVNLIFLSHVRNDKDEKKGYSVTRPEFMPKTSTTVRNTLALVSYMSADESHKDGKPVYVRKHQVHPTKTIVAKSRIGGLGVHTTTSTLCEVIPEWMGGKVETIEVQDVIDDLTPPHLSDRDDPVIEVQ